MQLMVLKAVAADVVIVEKHPAGGWKNLPYYTAHVMGHDVASQLKSLQRRKFVAFPRASQRKLELTLAGKEHLDNLTRELSYDTTVE